NSSSNRRSKAAVVVLAMCGSIVVGGNVAPTEEVMMIGIEASPLHVLIMAVFSVVRSAVVTFFSDFKSGGSYGRENFTYHLIFDTCVCYTVALGVSAFMLWFFGGFANMGFWNCFSQIIVLGVLSSLGASAGRL